MFVNQTSIILLCLESCKDRRGEEKHHFDNCLFSLRVVLPISSSIFLLLDYSILELSAIKNLSESDIIYMEGGGENSLHRI